MAFNIELLLSTISVNSGIFVTNPLQPVFGGAILKQVSPEHPLPCAEELGLVIASPNILRTFHHGFNAAMTERCLFEGDFMDRLIFVSRADYEDNKEAVQLIAAVIGALGRLADPEVSTGCSPSSVGTPVYQMRFSSKDGVPRLSFPLKGENYTVVAAKFHGEGMQGMVCTEYWISEHEHREMILSRPEYVEARKRSEANCPGDGAKRRQRTLELIAKLRKAEMHEMFQTSGS